MEKNSLSAPENIKDLYVLFKKAMLLSEHNFYGFHGLTEVCMYRLNASIDLFDNQNTISIWYTIGKVHPWHIDVRKHL